MTPADGGVLKIEKIHEKWLEMVKTQRASGLSAAQWCRENNFTSRQFHGRVQELRKLGFEIPPQRGRARATDQKKDRAVGARPQEPPEKEKLRERREDWLETVKAQRASGLSAAQWYRENNLTHGQFQGRVKALRKLGIEIPRASRASAPEDPGREKGAPGRNSEPRTFLVPGTTRGCGSIDRLRAVIEYRLGMDPFSGDRFVFRGGQPGTLYTLMWDGDGFVHTRKRKEKGFFRWPLKGAEVTELTVEQTSRLFKGERVI